MCASIDASQVDRRKREAAQLAAVLREMKEGLDTVKSKVEDLIVKVKANTYSTAEGMSYLEAKHLLLLSYCQSLVYYMLRKAKGFSIEGHPVVRHLVEIRLFLEKIRPIDKKMQYQIQKLTRIAGSTDELGDMKKESEDPLKTDDHSKYRPNPDMLVSKMEMETEDGIYRPPKFAPVSMDSGISKQERNASRRENHILRQATEDTYMKEVLDEIEGKPREVRDTIGADSRELKKFRAQWKERERIEEELFTRAPRTKEEKKHEKQLKKSRDGLMGLTEDFYDEIKFLPLEEKEGKEWNNFGDGSSKLGRPKKRRVK